MRRHRIVLLLLLCAPATADEGIVLDRDDLVVTGSVRVRPGVYRVRDANGDGVLHVTGKDAKLDLTGVTLVGADDDVLPDAFTGVGVSVDDAPGAVVTGGAVRGFKIGVRVHGSPAATVEKLDASGNYRQRLKSTVEREDASDWLFGHENDDGQWERNYGAGIACDRSPGVVVRECVVHRGQNGLLLQRCDEARAYDNDFSWNSGWGLALWRTCKAVVSHNSLDWCVRGTSHGHYARGQDSTAILVFEQSSDNVFAVNSGTHSGDGFFLYAGNETLQRTGKGGCNGNVVYGNDFSHAVANGIEATFSEGNHFLDNDLNDCEHGVWAGYSRGTHLFANRIADCTSGVSIEHGHSNWITGNSIARCGTGVHLWTDDDPDLAKSAYGRGRDTRSSNERITSNGFAANRVDVLLDATRETVVAGNECTGDLKLETRHDAAWSADGGIACCLLCAPPDETSVPGTRDVYLPAGTLRGRKYILIDEWGPVDPRETRLFPARVDAAGEARLSVLGVDGTFEVTSLTEGFVAEPAKGALPATLVIRRKDAAPGAATFDFEVTAKGTKHRASGSLLTTTWDVRFFRWTKDPREDADAWKALLASEPAERRTLPALDFAWQGGKVSDAVGGDRFGTLATANVELPAGKWTLRTVSDDGIRVWLDDRLVLDDWTHHGPTPHDADFDFPAAAKHRVRVEHFEIDGWAALSVSFAGR